MLDVRRMQVLRAVVTSGSVTAAAANLGYTPSAVSQQVAALEKQAGIALLERVGRGVQPTAAGLLLTKHADTISRFVAEAETELADLQAGRTGRLTIRYFATAGASLVAPALATFRRERPGVQVDLELADPKDPLPEVMRGRADLAIVVRPPHGFAEGVRLVHLLDDPYRVVLPRGHRLAGKPVVELADLEDEPWVGSELQIGPCFEVVSQACAAAGFSPSFVVQSEDHATAQGFVAAGVGISLIPRLGLQSPHPDVLIREIRRPEPIRAIHAVLREAAPAQSIVRSFVETLRQTAGDHQRDQGTAGQG
jgi:DNA-binding transcriptional LysR family regulator